jgi:hypothetical protein
VFGTIVSSAKECTQLSKAIFFVLQFLKERVYYALKLLISNGKQLEVEKKLA